MSQTTMIKAKYPLVGSQDFVEIALGQPEFDPESPQAETPTS